MKFLKISAAIVATLLLGSTTAQAATLIKDSKTAVRIEGLVIGSDTYDVDFTCNVPTTETYGRNPVFDFNDPTSANSAFNAILAVLNADGGVAAVGCGTGQGEFSVYIFRLAYDRKEISIDPPGQGKLEVPFLIVCEGSKAAGSDPVHWADLSGDSCIDSDIFGGNSVVARFTFVGSGGAGNSPPVAAAGGPYTGAVGEAVQFDGSGSNDTDGTIESYEWIFGDGNTGSGEKLTHTYGEAKTYNVTLTVTDDKGVSASNGTTSRIGASGKPPLAEAGGPYSGTAGKKVPFDGSASSDPDNSIAKYRWDFGDDSTAKGKKPKHKYKGTGKYTVTLQVTNDAGETDTDTATAEIAEGNQPPEADAGGPYNGEAGAKVKFDGSGSKDPDGTVEKYTWDFGDGKGGKGKSPKHKYKNAGTYSVTLTVKDNAGTKDSEGTSVEVK